MLTYKDLLGSESLGNYVLTYLSGSIVNAIIEEILMPSIEKELAFFQKINFEIPTGQKDANNQDITTNVPLSRILIKILLWAVVIYLIILDRKNK